MNKREPTDDEMLYYEALGEVNNEYSNDKLKQANYDLLDFNEEVKLKMEELKEKLSEIRLKNKDLKLFLLQVPKKINPPLDLRNCTEQEEYQRRWDEDYEKRCKSLDPIPNSIIGRYDFNEESITEEEFLYQMTKFEAPIKRDLKYKYELFEDLIFYIRSRESNRGLKYRLATGLSDSRKSLEILDNLVEETTKEKLIIDYSLTRFSL